MFSGAVCARIHSATGLKHLKRYMPQPPKIRHSREGGNPGGIEQIRVLDSRLRGNDERLSLRYVSGQSKTNLKRQFSAFFGHC